MRSRRRRDGPIVGWAKPRSGVPTRMDHVGTRASPALPTLRHFVWLGHPTPPPAAATLPLGRAPKVPAGEARVTRMVWRRWKVGGLRGFAANPPYDAGA